MILFCGKCYAPLVLRELREEPLCADCLYLAKREPKPLQSFTRPDTDPPDHKPIWERWEPPDVEEE